MMDKKYSKKKLTRQRGMLAAVSILLIVLLVAAACGAAATATPEPTAAPEPTAVPDEPTAVPDEPTAMPDTGLRPRSEWTEEEPVTFEELEAEIEKHRGESFVFTSWGGAYQAAQRQAYIVPYEQQFGIDVVEESPTEYPVIRAMVETGNYKWNVIDVGGRALWAEIKIGSLEELDKSVVDTSNHVDSVRNHPNPTYGGGGGITWSTVLAYNTDSYPEGSITTWADYFDRENFPGRRSVRDAYRASWFVALSVLHPEWYDDTELREASGSADRGRRAGCAGLLGRESSRPLLAHGIGLPAAVDKRRGGHMHGVERQDLRCAAAGRRVPCHLLGVWTPDRDRRFRNGQGPEGSGPVGFRKRAAVHCMDGTTADQCAAVEIHLLRPSQPEVNSVPK